MAAVASHRGIGLKAARRLGARGLVRVVDAHVRGLDDGGGCTVGERGRVGRRRGLRRTRRTRPALRTRAGGFCSKIWSARWTLRCEAKRFLSSPKSQATSMPSLGGRMLTAREKSSSWVGQKS